MTTMSGSEVFEDLEAEYAHLDGLLAGLDPEQWGLESGAAGWSVADVVLHLAQSEELVLASIAGDRDAFGRQDGTPLDELMDQRVVSERGSGSQVLARWREAAGATPGALRACPPDTRLSWATIPLSPRTLATTRLAEHWAHTLDVMAPLGLDYPDTARLRHIAWLGHRTLPYAFAVAGREGGPVFCELTGPSGELWRFGDPEAPSAITGPAGQFCRVGAHRLPPSETALETRGPHAEAALRVMRNYAV
ncbi:maleylpyruvate isomerase family mycothiol-dependent enzyme [Actinocorallia sp. B10E7]|uniref:maleylpyruvate isomerase family mycothiol-dependent enzyme n=1 Tax=Actinocorallia sp. B10E7 TaxID=3153558 RepID=UPI00325E0760